MLVTAIILLLIYIVFIVFRLGLIERIPLALGTVSLEQIPKLSARKYGTKILFTTDTPVNWTLPQLKQDYTNNTTWSAIRIEKTITFLSLLIKPLINSGDRVAICKTNHLDIHFFMQAIIRAGGIACPMNNKFVAQHCQPYLNHTGCKVLVSDSITLGRILQEGGNLGNVEKIILAEKRNILNDDKQQKLMALLAKIEELQLLFLEDCEASDDNIVNAEKRSSEDIFYLVHSSGTTGFPKAVVLKNGAQAYAVKGWLCYVHVSRFFDKAFLAVPNNHQAVILTFNSSLLMGFRVHWESGYDQYTFNPDKVMGQLADEQFTGFFGFPIAYTLLKETPLDKYSKNKIRFWASTADASHEVIQRLFVQYGAAFKALGIPLDGSIFMDAQGSSEVGTPSVLRYITRFTTKFERRIGKPGSIPFCPKVRIRINGDRLAKDGETGKLEVKGKTLFGGYWSNEEKTKEAFTDGWFFTGDVARKSPDGHIIQLDRLVDVIQTSYGEVYSLPIEEKIHKHPAVFDACVYGAYQSDGTSLPAVAIALRKGHNLSGDELLRALNATLTEKEQLHSCTIMPWSEFPIGVTGKTLKRVFRENSKLLHQVTQQKASKLFLTD